MKKLLLLFVLAFFMLPGRAFAQYSNASLNGTWISVNQYIIYITFDGNGTINELGSFIDSLHPVGTYSVSSSGVVTGTFNLMMGSSPFNGQFLNDSTVTSAYGFDSALGPTTLIKVSNPGGLVGTWNCSVYDSTTSITRNIQLAVNSSGDITSATGIPLIAGKFYETRDTFAGYITSSDSVCHFRFLGLMGWDNGIELSGLSDLGKGACGRLNCGGDNCNTKGSMRITKTAASAVKTTSSEIDFLVYPAPFSDLVEIAMETPITKMQIDLFDMLGRKVYSQEWSNAQKISLNLCSLSNGIYLVTLTADGKKAVKRILKN